MMETFLEETAKDLIQKLGTDISHSAIVFNNKRPVVYFRKYLAQLIGKPFWSPEFYTIQEFLTNCSDLVIADKLTQFFTLLGEYNKLLESEGKEAYTPDSFYPTAQTILSDFTELDADLADVNKVFSILEENAQIKELFPDLSEENQQFLVDFWHSYYAGQDRETSKTFMALWQRMPALYANFHQSLRKQGLATIGHAYRAATATKDNSFLEKFKQGKIVFIGFNALSKAETCLFKQWQQEGRALFYFDTDSHYLNDKMQEAGYFLRKDFNSIGLKNELGNNYPNNINKPDKHIQIIQAQGNTAQARILGTQLQTLYPLLKTKDNSGKIAIVLADESLLLPVLQSIPSTVEYNGETMQIPVNVTMGFPLTSSPLFGLIDLWLQLQQDYLERNITSISNTIVKAVLTHPLIKYPKEKTSRFTEKIIENNWYEVPMEEINAGGELLSLFFEKSKGGNNLLQSLQKLLENLLQQQYKNHTLRQLSYGLFTAVLQSLNRLSDEIQGFEKNLSDKFLLLLIRRVIQGISVPLSGEPLQGIQVMGLLESRSLDFEHLFIVGTGEDHLPANANTQTFLPENIRRAFGLSVQENRDAISAYIFYRLLQRSHNISLIFNGAQEADNSGEPSRFIRQLQYETNIHFDWYNYNQKITIETIKPISIDKKDGYIQKALEQYYADSPTKQRSLSPSAFAKYNNCSLQFFYSYIADIKEPEDVQENIAPNTIGEIVHRTMEAFYQPFLQNNILVTKDEITEGQKRIKALVDQTLKEELFPNRKTLPALNGMQQVARAIIEENIQLILEEDKYHAPFSIQSLENKDMHYAFPIELNGKTEKIILQGTIDRVDKCGNITRIVDYKTGSDRLDYKSVEELFLDTGKQNKAMVQTLYYTYIYEQLNKIKGVEPNLYVIRNMKKEGVHFKSGSGKNAQLLTGTFLEEAKTAFIKFLGLKLQELFNVDIPFTQTENIEHCQYCLFKTICKR